MIKEHKGLFISVEGPNGSGKSTFIKSLSNKLSQRYRVYQTCEPSHSALGNYARYNEANLNGLPYAYLICANRCEHIEQEVIPHLQHGDIVISDRYIDSCMVYQKYEGVSYEQIWELNHNFLIPDLNILLTADKTHLEERLTRRDRLTRYEKAMSREQELQLYLNARNFLESKGFHYLSCCNNTLEDLEINVNQAYNKISILCGE